MNRTYLVAMICLNLHMAVYSQALSYEDTKQYIGNYMQMHSAFKNSYTKAYYVRSRAFVFMDSFFQMRDHAAFTGVTFYFVAYPDESVKGQKDEFESLIYAAPSKGNAYKPRVTDHEAFSNFLASCNRQNFYFKRDQLNKGEICPGLCDDTLRKWDPSHAVDHLTQMPDDAPEHMDAFLFSGKNTQLLNRMRHIGNHEEEYDGKETNSIYFKKSTIHNLATFIQQNLEDDYPLIGIYLASYNGPAPAGTYGQGDLRQTTLIFIPLKYDGVNYAPDIKGYVEFLKKLDKIKNTENHGELCPSNCPDEGK